MKLCASLAAMSLIAASPLRSAAQDAPAWPYRDDIPTVSDQGLESAADDAARYANVQKATGGTISPDGKTIAYATSKTGQPQLWSVPSEGGEPRQISDGKTVNSFFWAPDSSGLIYLADTHGDELPIMAFVSADGKTKRQLVASDDAFKIFGDFASDGDTAIFSSTRRNGDDYDLYFLDLETGKSREAYRGKFEWTAAAWQPNGDYIVVRETRGADAHDLYLFNAKTETMITLYTPKVAAQFDQINWRADGRGFYMATNLGREFKALVYYDLASGELTQLETPQADIDAVSLGANDQYIAWVVNQGGYSALQARHLRSNSLVALPDLPAGVYEIEIADAAPIMQITISGPQIPSDVWTYNFVTGALVRATTSDAAGLDLRNMVMPQTVRFKARDGVTLQGLLYMPPEATVSASSKPPVIIALHGGPSEQALPVFDENLQYLIARGYAVLDLNYRGSLGFGKSFARLDNQQNRADVLNDIADAAAWLNESGRVDAKRTGVYGMSYGGYLVHAALSSYPDLFQAGVSQAGVSDWVRALEGASPSLKASNLLEYGDISDPKIRAFHAEISPLAKANRIKAPILVIHGANDPRDPVSDSDQLVKAVRDAGGRAAYIRFADEGHDIEKIKNNAYALRRIGSFFDQHFMPARPAAKAATAEKVAASQAPLEGSQASEPARQSMAKTGVQEDAAVPAKEAATAALAVTAEPADKVQAAKTEAEQQEAALSKQLETLQQEALDLEAEREAKRAAQEAQKAVAEAEENVQAAALAAQAAKAALDKQQAALKAATKEADAAQKLLNRAEAQIAKTQAESLEAKEALAKAQSAIKASAQALEKAKTQKQNAQAALDTAKQAKAQEAASLAALQAEATQAQSKAQAARQALEALSGEPKRDDAAEKGLLDKASDIVKSVVDKVTGEAP
jgi:dipeptidyl aminopeptidase/acylaminoacyl peptidase